MQFTCHVPQKVVGENLWTTWDVYSDLYNSYAEDDMPSLLFSVHWFMSLCKFRGFLLLPAQLFPNSMGWT
jgi:hypothetical protein